MAVFERDESEPGRRFVEPEATGEAQLREFLE